jgi:hypothetical protein
LEGKISLNTGQKCMQVKHTDFPHYSNSRPADIPPLGLESRYSLQQFNPSLLPHLAAWLIQERR